MAWYILNPSRGAYLPISLEVLAFEGERVKEIVAFASPELFSPFGLPPELPPGPAD